MNSEMTTDKNVWAIVNEIRKPENTDLMEVVKGIGDGSTPEESFMFGFRHKLSAEQQERFTTITSNQEEAEGLGGWSGAYFGWAMRWVQHIVTIGATQS